MTRRTELRDVLVEVLSTTSDLTAREIVALLPERGYRAADRSRVNGILYSNSKSFANDGHTPPRWSLKDGRGTPKAAGPKAAGGAVAAQSAALPVAGARPRRVGIGRLPRRHRGRDRRRQDQAGARRDRRGDGPRRPRRGDRAEPGPAPAVACPGQLVAGRARRDAAADRAAGRRGHRLPDGLRHPDCDGAQRLSEAARIAEPRWPADC